MLDTPTVVQEAMTHHRSGNLDHAQQLYQQVLTVSPKNTTVLHLLGCVHLQRGEHAKAKHFIAQAIKINPSVAAFYNNMGTTLRAQGKVKPAITNYKQAVRLNPDYAEAYYNLGTVLMEQGHFKRAKASFQSGLKIQPTHFGLWHNLGRLLHDQGQPGQAQRCYHKALELKPDLAQAQANLAHALRDQHRFEEAITAYRQAIRIDPHLAGIHLSLGHCLRQMNRLNEAIQTYQQQVHLTPHDAQAHNALAGALRARGHLKQAVKHYRQAVRLAPRHAPAHHALSDALCAQGHYHQAITGYREALRLKPSCPDTHNNLAYALVMVGRIDDALACCREALRLKPGFALANSNLAFFLNYDPNTDAAMISGEYRRWARKHTKAPKKPAAFPNTPDPDRPLRIGYLSPYFRTHPVGYYLEAVLGQHRPQAVETYCYAQVEHPDALTDRLRSCATRWRSTVGHNDLDIAKMIRNDRIDILVNAATHTLGHRLGVVARRPAPVQAAWLGGPVTTTGLNTVDYVISDHYQTPESDDPHFTEQVIRLPHGYVCYQPPQHAPPVAPLPALQHGCVTFGCFNTLAKLNESVIKLWSALLKRLPATRLVLKTKALNEKATRENLQQRFERHGVDPTRIEPQPGVPHTQLLASYHEIDIALDPFPYSGGVTTLEALWMGVPVVTLNPPGRAVRHSVSHLSNAGLQELITSTPEAYLDTAASLAQNLARLQHRRATLRQTLTASPLCDAPRFVANLEQAYRKMWLAWCQRTHG